MKNLTVSLCLLATVFTSNFCKADCIEDNWIFLGDRVTQIGDCTEGEPLALDRKGMDYPMMEHNPYVVEYWRGSYVRKITNQSTYLHLVVDKCSHKDHVI